MSEEMELPKILTEVEVEEIITEIKNNLGQGKFNGSGRFHMRGIQGDIENIFGWHGIQSPQSEITQQQRVDYLEEFVDLSESACETQDIPLRRSPVEWMKQRIQEIKQDEAKKLLQDDEYSSHEIVQQIKDIDAKMSQQNVSSYQDTHSMAAQINQATNDEGSHRALFSQRKGLLVSLYDSVYKKAQ